MHFIEKLKQQQTRHCMFNKENIFPRATFTLKPNLICGLTAEPDFTKCVMFLNNIVINQSDLKNQFIVFVKFGLTISVFC